MAKKRKKRRRRSGMPIIIVLTILLLAVLIAGAVYYLFGNSLMLPGTWEREIDLTAQVTENIENYLKETAYGEEIDVRPYVEQITVTSRLTVTKDGEWAEVVDSDDYAEMTNKSLTALNRAVTELLGKRIADSYIETDLSVDELVKDAVGMNLTSYLSQYGPTLMPTYAELSEKYGCSATYESDREIITISPSMGDSKDYTYMTAKGTLVLDGKNSTVVYHKAEEE